MKCGNCGEENPAGEEYCKGCGSPLLQAELAPVDANATPTTVTPASTEPVVMTFTVDGVDYQLREGGTLRFVRKGSTKKQDGDIELDSDSVSGSPVEIKAEGGKVKARDTGSSSGFGKTITVGPNQEAPVEPGDLLMLGEVVIATS